MPSRRPLNFDAQPFVRSRWDTTMEVILVAMLGFMPIAFGAVEAWSQLIVLLGAALLSVLLVLRWALDRDFRLPAIWTFVPLSLFIVFVGLQMAALPVGFAEALSPATVSIRKEMLAADFQPSRWIAISIYPYATGETLRLVLLGAVIYVTVASVIRSRRQITSLLTAIFLIGCAEALLGVAQIATGTNLIYWVIPTSGAVQSSGSFVNYSHFCQFMNLSLGAGIGLLLLQLNERRRGESQRADRLLGLSRIHWETQGWIIVGLVLCATAVFTSMSRGGIISLVIATGIIALALGRRGSLNWQGWLIGAVPVGVFLIVLVFGLDRFLDRLALLQHSEVYASRWGLARDTLRVWQTFPLLGAGLGTHEFIFPMFDSSVLPVLAANADTEYAQLLEETGVVGALFVAAFLIAMAGMGIRLAFRGRSSTAVAAFGVGFGLLAVAIHSATDFGQRIPAILCLSATACGLLVSLGRLESRARRSNYDEADKLGWTPPWVRWTAACTGLVTVLAVWGWALGGEYAAYLGERWWAAAYTLAERIQNSREQGTDEEYIDLIAAAEHAFASDPGNVAYGYWLAYYRWEALSRTTDTRLQQTVLDREAMGHVARIADELAAVRNICPTYGPPYALEGQLRLNILGEERGAELIRKGFRLAPYDPPTCLVAGELAARQGNMDEARRLLSRAVQLQPGYYGDVIDVYLFDLNRPDLARELAGDDFARLQALLAACAKSETFDKFAEDLEAECEAVLRRRVKLDDATSSELAALADIDLGRREFATAIELYRRALAKEYRQLDWRISLARALAETGRIEDGITELRICLRLRQDYPAAKRLLEELLAKVDNSPR